MTSTLELTFNGAADDVLALLREVVDGLAAREESRRKFNLSLGGQWKLPDRMDDDNILLVPLTAAQCYRLRDVLHLVEGQAEMSNGPDDGSRVDQAGAD